MKKFKASVSKWESKYSIVMEWENIEEVKQKIHKEWYSILNLEDFIETSTLWEKFLFIAKDNWEIKKWAIIWDDIFKAYFKLRNWLKYNISEFYLERDKDLDTNSKEKLLKSLDEQYNIAILKKEVNKWKIENNQEKTNDKLDNFYMKKELEESHKIIDLVLSKLKSILESTTYNISDEEKEKYKLLYNNIIKLKNITNIPKIKEVWEIALMKVWNLELTLIEKDKTNNSKLLLGETNKLLKQIWSKNQIIPKNKDLKYIIVNFYNEAIKPILFPNKVNLVESIDKNSYSYLKTKVLYEKYNNKLKENQKEILKNLIKIIFPFWDSKTIKEHLFLKRKVIKQNIVLLGLKISWRKFSYTDIINWYLGNANIIKYISDLLWKSILNIILIYSIIYIWYLNYLFYTSNIFKINYEWIYIVLFLSLIFFLVKFSKWIFSFLFNSAFFYFIIIFFQVNF